MRREKCMKSAYVIGYSWRVSEWVSEWKYTSNPVSPLTGNKWNEMNTIRFCNATHPGPLKEATVNLYGNSTLTQPLVSPLPFRFGAPNVTSSDTPLSVGITFTYPFPSLSLSLSSVSFYIYKINTIIEVKCKSIKVNLS